MLLQQLSDKDQKTFVKKIKILPSGCWVWTGGKCAGGYVQIYRNGKRHMVHRYLYEIINGEIPAGLSLDHLCRVRNCVNPDHLEPVTHQENISRGTSGANNRNKTHCKNGHKFTHKNTYITKKGFRHCRECHRISESHRRSA